MIIQVYRALLAMAVAGAVATGLLLLFVGFAHAQNVTVDATLTKACPPEKPHRLEIETGTMSCTSALCMGRIDCGSGTCKVTRDLGDGCNTCQMRSYVACFSEEDLKSIRR